MADQILYTDDICRPIPLGDLISPCVVDVTPSEVGGHVPSPQRGYDKTIGRQSDIPERQFKEFLKTGRPPPGTVLVTWYEDNRPELVRTNSLKLLHRGITFGDIVKKGPRDAMSGTIIAQRDYYNLVQPKVCPPLSLEHLDGAKSLLDIDSILTRIPGDELKSVDEFSVDDHITYRDWLGRVDDVTEEVTIRLSNNSMVVVADPLELGDDVQIGDVVATPKWNVKKGRWISGAYDPLLKPVGQILDIRIIGLSVVWIARRLGMSDSTERPQPPEVLGLDELNSGGIKIVSSGLKNSVKHAREFDLFRGVRFIDLPAAKAKYDGTPREFPPDGQTCTNQVLPIARTETLGYDMNVFSVNSFNSMLTVQWQDATIAEYPSIQLHPQLELEDATEFFPGQIVVPKVSPEATRHSWHTSKIGVIQSVSAIERIARVLWQPNADCDYFVEVDTKKIHLESGYKTRFPVLPLPKGPGFFEDVPVFDLLLAPGINRRLGDLVLISESTANGDSAKRTSVNGSSLNFSSSSSVAWAGRVTGIKLDGTLTIDCIGVDNATERVLAPEATVLIVSTLDYWDSDSQADDSETDSAHDDESDIFDEGQRTPIEVWFEDENGDVMELDSNDEDEWSTEGDEDEMDIDVSTENEHQTAIHQNDEISTEEGGAISNKSKLEAGGNQIGPPKYDVLDSAPPLDQHFISIEFSNSSPQRLRRIRKEHAVLSGSLPEGVYVRSWESRLDLFRVLFVGPVDTPYEYAPFFMDFMFPENFPHSPPKAFFHSWTSGHGSVNPNLYEDGKVCLSLLNT
jgi:ubiquitin-conjugating enzyme E2 O